MTGAGRQERSVVALILDFDVIMIMPVMSVSDRANDNNGVPVPMPVSMIIDGHGTMSAVMKAIALFIYGFNVLRWCRLWRATTTSASAA